MKVAVSGTHGCGKSTLIEHFLMTQPDFTHEPEPDMVLQEDYGEVFAAEPSADDFYRQLEFNIERLRRYPPHTRVIYERCPIDFLAYLLALSHLRSDQEAARLVERSLDQVQDAIKLLDLIVFLPLDGMVSTVISDAAEQELRMAVDDCLVDIFRGNDLNLCSGCHPRILELCGSPAERLLQYSGLIPFAVLGQSADAEETLRQAAQRVDQIADPTTKANLMAASGILAGLKLEEEVVYRILRRDIMQESTVYRSILAEGEVKKQREIAINLLRRGVAIDIIAPATGLSVEEVQQLQQQINKW